jgi:hypothetical protein
MYRGGYSAFFVALVNGAESTRRKLRVCSNDATLLLEKAAAHLVKVSEGDEFYPQPNITACSNCHGDLGAHAQAVFVTAYPRGLLESQWYGQVCEACCSAVAEDWSLQP